MKALSVWQPWASLIADYGQVARSVMYSQVARAVMFGCTEITAALQSKLVRPKTIETRKWRTGYRGDLLICSTQKPRVGTLPAGQALCIANLVDCRPMTEADEAAACCRWGAGRFAWVLEDIRPLTRRFEVKGGQRLFNVTVARELLEVS